MSAPKTDLDKQEKRHKGPLGGMAAVVVVALALLLGLLIWLSANGNTPEGADTQIDSRTGAEVAPEGSAPAVPEGN